MKNATRIVGLLFLFSLLALLAPAAFAAEATAAPTLKDQITSIVVQVVLPFALTALAGATTWVFVQLKRLIAAKVGNTRLAGILARLDDHVLNVVLATEQAVRPTLESVAKTGKLDAADAARLKEAALAQLKTHLGVGGLKELLDVLGIQAGFLDQFLGSRVEATVAKLPASNPQPIRVVTSP